MDHSLAFDEALYTEQQPKMAVLTSPDFLSVEVVEGKEHPLEFTVENKSTMAWPFKPFVQNEKDKSVKQHVDTVLQPGETATIRYMFRAPLYADQKSVHMLLQLVEPRNYEKFCNDTVVAVCNVLPSSSASGGNSAENDSLFELGFSLNGDDMKMMYNTASVPGRHT